jgi:hypothetical protein
MFGLVLEDNDTLCDVCMNEKMKWWSMKKKIVDSASSKL